MIGRNKQEGEGEALEIVEQLCFGARCVDFLDVEVGLAVLLNWVLLSYLNKVKYV